MVMSTKACGNWVKLMVRGLTNMLMELFTLEAGSKISDLGMESRHTKKGLMKSTRACGRRTK